MASYGRSGAAFDGMAPIPYGRVALSPYGTGAGGLSGLHVSRLHGFKSPVFSFFQGVPFLSSSAFSICGPMVSAGALFELSCPIQDLAALFLLAVAVPFGGNPHLHFPSPLFPGRARYAHRALPYQPPALFHIQGRKEIYLPGYRGPLRLDRKHSLLFPAFCLTHYAYEAFLRARFQSWEREQRLPLVGD